MPSTKPRTPKIQVTKNYRMFRRSPENRVVDVTRHKALLRSMKKYGWLPCFPLVAYPPSNGKPREVREGQHRLTIAESLGLPVYWTETTIDFDIAEINTTSVTWKPRDFAERYAAQGRKAYIEGLEFADQHGLPVGRAFTLLAGTVSWTNIKQSFITGTYKIKDRPWAEAVASIYVPLVAISCRLRNARFAEACMAVCRVDDFNAARLLRNAERCREKLAPYSTRDAYLDMLEDVYNYGQKRLVGLKAAATMAMRARSASEMAKQKKAAKKRKTG